MIFFIFFYTGIVHMAGFSNITMSYLNNYFNTLLCERRKKLNISEVYDGSKTEEVEEYNRQEERLAVQRERLFNE